jgi:hypothetical protein
LHNDVVPELDPLMTVEHPKMKAEGKASQNRGFNAGNTVRNPDYSGHFPEAHFYIAASGFFQTDPA